MKKLGIVFTLAASLALGSCGPKSEDKGCGPGKDDCLIEEELEPPCHTPLFRYGDKTYCQDIDPMDFR